MARRLNTLLVRSILGALSIELVLAPLLFWGVMRVVEHSETEQFVDDVRAYARFLADTLEADLPTESKAEIVDLLDSIVLSKETTYAELRSDAFDVRSSLSSNAQPYYEDFSFGEHGDSTYFLSIPLNAGGSSAVLRLGFNEERVRDAMSQVRERVFWLLAAFIAMSILLAAVVAAFLIGPLRDLQRASQAVASGKFDARFRVSSGVAEIRELALDLETMRDHLVQANARLTVEMQERMESEQARMTLERRLRHVQKLETVGTLAGGIAHEFNNILVPIKVYTELALDELPAKSSLRVDLQRVIAATARAKNVVQKILTFSRQSHTEHYETVDVVGIVREVLTLARDLFPSTVRIVERIEAHHLSVLCDAAQIHQLVMNLLNNAYQAIGPDGGAIVVDLIEQVLGEARLPSRTNLVPGRYVVLSISDTGHGMDRATLERIFEPFYTTRPAGEGTGLGLSVAHGIASRHGGDIAVESELGRGSTFAVYLPLSSKTTAQLKSPGLHNVLYVELFSGDNEHRVAASAIGGRTRRVSSKAELSSLLTLEEGVDLWILDFGIGTPPDFLKPEHLLAWQARDLSVLVLGDLTPTWSAAVTAWPKWRVLPGSADVATVLATIRVMRSEEKEPEPEVR